MRRYCVLDVVADYYHVEEGVGFASRVSVLYLECIGIT